MESHDKLWARYQAGRDVAVRNQLAELYLPLVKKLAAKLASRLPPSAGVTVDDLRSYGSTGLLQAIERFDPERGLQFPTFAGPRVNGAMLDGLRSMDWVPRLERRKQSRGEVTPSGMFSFDAITTGPERGEVIAFHDPDAPHPSASIERAQAMGKLLRGMGKVDRLVLLLYYCDGLTMKQIGASVRLSESRVSQLHSELITRLRSKGHPDEWPELGARQLGFAGSDTAEPAAQRGAGKRTTRRALARTAVGVAGDERPADLREATDVSARCAVHERTPGGSDQGNPQAIPAAGAADFAEGMASGVGCRSTANVKERSRFMSKNLQELLDALTPDEIRTEIETKERELAALRILLKVALAKAGEAAPKRARSDTSGGEKGAGGSHVERALTYLEAAGPSKASKIADDCKIPRGSITAVLSDNRFKKTSDGLYVLRGRA